MFINPTCLSKKRHNPRSRGQHSEDNTLPFGSKSRKVASYSLNNIIKFDLSPGYHFVFTLWMNAIYVHRINDVMKGDLSCQTPTFLVHQIGDKIRIFVCARHLIFDLVYNTLIPLGTCFCSSTAALYSLFFSVPNMLHALSWESLKQHDHSCIVDGWCWACKNSFPEATVYTFSLYISWVVSLSPLPS